MSALVRPRGGKRRLTPYRLRYGVRDWDDWDDWCRCACHDDEDACDPCGWDWCEGDCDTFDARGGEVWRWARGGSDAG